MGRLAVVAILVCAIVAVAFAEAWAPAMTPVRALQTLEQATADFKGTRADHILIQDSLRMLKAVVEQYETTAPVDEEKQ